jgi:hypothetical protein
VLPEEESTPLLRSALHRLAQPLMASLCISEFLGNGAGGELERTLDHEIRRSVAVFTALQQLLEVRRISAVVDSICVAELLRARLADPALSAEKFAVAVPETMVCHGNRMAVERALGLLLTRSQQARAQDGSMTLSACRSEGAIELRLMTETEQGEQIAADLRGDECPFESKSFDFQGRMLPEIAIVQQGLEASGGSLRIEATATALTFVLSLRAAPAVSCM